MSGRDLNPHEAAVKRLGKLSDKDRRGWRINIYKDTRRIVNIGSYQNPDGTTVVFPRIPTDRSQQVRSAEEVPEPSILYDECRVAVYEGDCVDAARHYARQGLSVAVLNMASDKSPGGGVKSGAGAQEENLFRRSNYFQHLNRDVARYPIPPTGGIYTPGVVFFREAEAEDYRMMEPIVLSMVAVPAIRHPRIIRRGGELALSEPDEELAKNKIRTMLKLAASHNHEVVILSAWGCGAFANPPVCVARAFREMLDTEFLRRFKRVVFAIFEDHNARKGHNPEGNVQPFATVFNTQVAHQLEELI